MRNSPRVIKWLVLAWVLPSLGWTGGEENFVLNIWGRPGLLVEDTAGTFSSDTVEIVGNLFYEHYGDRDVFLSPLGMSWGLSNSLDFYVNGTLQTIDYKASGSSAPEGLNRVTAGGAYDVNDIVKGLRVSMALDVSLGPFFPGFGPYTTDFNPKSIVTYVLDNKLLVSSEYGVYFPQAPYPVYQQFSLGAAYSFLPSWGAVVEFLHHTMGGPDVPGTIGLIGLRTSGSLSLRGFLGTHVDSVEAPNFVSGLSLLVNL